MSAALDLVRRRRSGPLGNPVAVEQVINTLPARSRSALDDEDGQVAALGRALGNLLPERRVAVRLHLDGKSREDIALYTGWTEARTRNLLYRGLADLKAFLQAEGA